MVFKVFYKILYLLYLRKFIKGNSFLIAHKKIQNIFHLLLDSRHKRSTLSTLKFIIGEDQTCPSLNEDLYCNGPLAPGTSYMYDFVNPNKLCIGEKCVFYKWLVKHMRDMFLFWKMLSIIILKEDAIQMIHGLLLSSIWMSFKNNWM